MSLEYLELLSIEAEAAPKMMTVWIIGGHHHHQQVTVRADAEPYERRPDNFPGYVIGLPPGKTFPVIAGDEVENDIPKWIARRWEVYRLHEIKISQYGWLIPFFAPVGLSWERAIHQVSRSSFRLTNEVWKHDISDSKLARIVGAYMAEDRPVAK